MTKFSELSIDTRFEQAQQENGHGIKVDGPTTKLNCVFEATVCISCGQSAAPRPQTSPNKRVKIFSLEVELESHDYSSRTMEISASPL
jgi:hypothetical protein